MILGDQCSFPLRKACVTVWQPYVLRDFQSNKAFTFELIQFVTVILCIRIHTNGSIPIIILCFRFLCVAFAFVIRITHKWKLRFNLCVMRMQRGNTNTPVTPNPFLLLYSEWVQTACKFTERSTNLLNVVQTY